MLRSWERHSYLPTDAKYTPGQMAEVVAGYIRKQPVSHWRELMAGCAKDDPELGRRVEALMVEPLFKPLGAWLESEFPWLFEEPVDGDDAGARR